MATDLRTALREKLLDSQYIREHEFEVLRELSMLVNQQGVQRSTNEMVLRALSQRAAFVNTGEILDTLARGQGLYPYVNAEVLGFADQLAYEYHRPLNLDNIVFHRLQGDVYRNLLAGENVILSAPTSFGKSLIIDAMIATGRYNNVVVIVPTLSLIDETRRRLFTRFGAEYKIITHPGQSLAGKNIYVLTQERVIDFPGIESVDFFVIDEFYKLDPRSDQDRSVLLNQAFYRMRKTGAQFYLLGPNIRSIPSGFEGQFDCKFIWTDYSTVVTEVTRIPSTRHNKAEKLVDLCRTLTDPTIIYCASPASARRVVADLLENQVGKLSGQMDDVVRWISKEYHPGWILAKSLRRGIGIHHARMPRSLSQYVVRAFNAGDIQFLVCTSTLIEGVNTAAKNVVIYDHKIATKNLDFFTFNNIKGRSGRMFRHFIGRVFLFNDPPQEELPVVDIPLATQSADAPSSLLIQMDEADLTVESRERVRLLTDGSPLTIQTLRANAGIDPKAQQDLAREIDSKALDYHATIRWTGVPDYDQLKSVCELIWRYLVPDNRRRAGVSSGSQLAYKISRFRSLRSIPELIREELQSAESADDAVENVLEFIRYWPTFNFPRYLMAVDRIQAEVFRKARLAPGDYSVFAAQVENLFLPAGVVALEEYGIPLQLAERLIPSSYTGRTFDDVLSLVRRMDPARVAQDPFEADLMRDALRFI
jgi:hypothetical protein